jgi:redox-sensitive bicupin YhaK (pirin superfamily)
MVVFENDADTIQLSVLEKTRFIVLSGEPLNEPVESYGPFVMTNQTEVMQAIRDAQMGKMGVLIEEFED